MRSIFNKFINVMLILLLLILILNRYYVIEFNVTLRNIFIYLSLIIILLTSIKEALEGSGFNKFLGITIILCAIVGGILTVMNGKLNLFVFLCLLFSLVHSFLELNKALCYTFQVQGLKELYQVLQRL